jgi:hypothetical protein
VFYFSLKKRDFFVLCNDNLINYGLLTKSDRRCCGGQSSYTRLNSHDSKYSMALVGTNKLQSIHLNLTPNLGPFQSCMFILLLGFVKIREYATAPTFQLC